ncbi:hypothetical protein ACFY1A_21145 [Streptomyces sp. NPDC001520]|uniref:hypothetical protein n=1 Tax=Streptomyces sp. NPDC001520 TaxID=3364581 RepID=UPI0036B8084D
MTARDMWLCPARPFGHTWDDTGLCCSLCGAERTAAEAIASVAGSHRGWTVQRAERLAAAHRAEVRREVLGDDLNPSELVLNANAYQWLADAIRSTMTDPDRWDGDEAEEAVLARYVQWLAAGRAARDAEVLREAAEVVGPRCEEYGVLGVGGLLHRMADEAGKVTPTGAGITQPAELTIYRASHDSIVMGLYTTREAAREHCEAEERSSWPGRTGITFAWIPDDSDPLSPEELSVFAGQNDESATGYVVTPLTVASEYDEEADE